CLVFNDTKVIPAQLNGVRIREGAPGAEVGFTLHMRAGPDCWMAFAKGAKKLRVDDVVQFGDALSANIESKSEGGEVALRFNKSGPALDAAIMEIGHVPLPPYIAAKRGEDAKDLEDYQTIYAKEDGAVAAPTAGLHFTDELFSSLDAAGIGRAFVTLHVGAGTFLPVKVEDTKDHKMHSEIGFVDDQVVAQLNAVKAKGGRVVAVGTTSLRLLESAANDDGSLSVWRGSTDIFITPGYAFKFVDVLMTNFHLPRSTLMMLVSAFAGYENMRLAYNHAKANNYRFYSYGDSSLLFPESRDK
ncbi:MAG: tRNA preQ1(34) S-adenosylmethionine ribosyltransferase-isomerase QueA, partial [Pseudomonadota bacterium]